MKEAASADRGTHDQIVSLTETMIELHGQQAEIKAGHDREAIMRQIAAADRQIDQLVYELYGLTDKEIRIVEEATKR